MKSSGKNYLYIISIIVCFSVLYLIFKDISLKQVVDLILNADKKALLIFLVLSMTMSFLRMLRYKVLLNFAGLRPNSLALFLVVLIRNFCSDLLPARLGSLVYVFLLNKRLGISLNQATSSFSLALAFDVCSVAPLVLLALFFLGDETGISSFTISVAAIVFLLLCFVLILAVPFLFRTAASVLQKMSFLSDKIREPSAEFFHTVNKDIQEVKAAGLYARIFILSILIRFFKYAGLYFLLYAMLSPKGYSYGDLPWARVFFGLIVPEFVESLPVSGVAGFGAYQGTWVFMFELLKFPAELAKITSVSHKLFSQIYGFSISLISAFLLLLPFPKARLAQ